MDHLPALGRVIPEVAGPTFKLYGDLLQNGKTAAAIHSTPRQEFSYGPHDRHRLDVYEPAASDNVGSRPILIFVHGGGFISGDKRLDNMPGDVAYANIGHFFASHFGFTTITVNYRLIGHGAKYPSGPGDIDLVLRWVEENLTDRNCLYLLGNSAGGVHVASWLFGRSHTNRRDQLIKPRREGLRICAVGFLGTPFHLDPEGPMKPLLSMHYGEPELSRAEEPLALMLRSTEGLSGGAVADWPALSVLVCELDPDDIKASSKQFADSWKSKGGRGNFVEIPKHNHISPVLSVGTGLQDEEAWGNDFGRWLSQQDKVNGSSKA